MLRDSTTQHSTSLNSHEIGAVYERTRAIEICYTLTTQLEDLARDRVVDEILAFTSSHQQLTVDAENGHATMFWNPGIRAHSQGPTKDTDHMKPEYRGSPSDPHIDWKPDVIVP
jgi:hypothetical protein